MPRECKNVFQMLSSKNINAQRIFFPQYWSLGYMLSPHERGVSCIWLKIFQMPNRTDLLILLIVFLKPVRLWNLLAS